MLQAKALRALTLDFAVVDDTVSLGKILGLEVNNEVVEELVEDHNN